MEEGRRGIVMIAAAGTFNGGLEMGNKARKKILGNG